MSECTFACCKPLAVDAHQFRLSLHRNLRGLRSLPIATYRRLPGVSRLSQSCYTPFSGLRSARSSAPRMRCTPCQSGGCCRTTSAPCSAATSVHQCCPPSPPVPASNGSPSGLPLNRGLTDSGSVCTSVYYSHVLTAVRYYPSVQPRAAQKIDALRTAEHTGCCRSRASECVSSRLAWA